MTCCIPHQNSGDDTNPISVADGTTLPQFMEPMAPMTSSAGTKFMVPEAFLEFCDQLMRENKTLRATSNTQGAACSTEVYEDRARNVRLQDTYVRANIRLIRHTTTPHLPRCIYRTGLSHCWPTVPEPGGRGETSREEKYLRTEAPVEQKTRR